MAETTTGAGSRTKVEPGIWFRLNATGRRVYEIVYRDSEGRQRQETIAGGLQDARTRLHDLKARLGKGERIVPNRRLTFAEASSAWIEAKAPNLAPKTIAIYSYALNVHLLPAFGRTKLADIDVRVVAKFVARMGGTEYRREVEARTGESKAQMGYSAQTIKSVLIPLSRTFAYAIRHLDHAGANPVAALDLDERPGYRQHRARKVKLGREDLDKLVAAAESPWREIICTALALGTRLGETLGLEWRHIDSPPD
jgi:integrase